MTDAKQPGELAALANLALPPPMWSVNEDGPAMLIVRCAYCVEHPGSQHDDGSGVCPACKGSAWHVLALEAASPQSDGEERA